MTGDAPLDLSVIVVSHGHEALLPACLGSLDGALAGLVVEIIVIDNLQHGRVAAALADFGRPVRLPVRLIENPRPVGFAANVNRGAASASGACLFILNPDTEHHAGTLAETLRWLSAHPDVGLLGCTLLDPDGTPQQNYRRFPSLAFLLVRGLGGDRWPWRPGFYRAGLMADTRPGVPHPVDWVFGAALLIRRGDFERIGGMDEGFRLYYEDVDLAWRLRRAGLGTWIFPRLSFRHAHQRSSARHPFGRTWRWHVRSALRYFWKTRGGRRPRAA